MTACSSIRSICCCAGKVCLMNMLHGGMARKVKEDRIEKFENPAILLGLKNDGIL